MVCAFTGHRPAHLPWGTREADERCLALKQLLRKAVLAAYGDGCRTFLCGMARGCDLYFAETVLTLRDEGTCPDALLTAMLPCPSQTSRWPADEQVRQAALLRRCDSVRMLESAYSEGCMLRRNRAMVDECDRLITVYDGRQGGTAATVRYARAQGRTIVPLWR